MTGSAWRAAPLISGVAGLGWVWAELAPQRAGFPDTDDPSVSLQFLAAHPGSHAMAGIWLMVAALALIATVLDLGRRFATDEAGGGAARTPPAAEYVRIIGILAGALLFGMAVVRLSEGPVRYVQSLDQGWGETAYLVTQFVGVQGFAVGGLLLLALWIAGTAWLGAASGLVPRALAVLALLPAVRIIGVLGPLGVEVEGAWILLMVAIPAAFGWVAILGTWQLVRPIAFSPKRIADPVPL